MLHRHPSVNADSSRKTSVFPIVPDVLAMAPEQGIRSFCEALRFLDAFAQLGLRFLDLGQPPVGRVPVRHDKTPPESRKNS